MLVDTASAAGRATISRRRCASAASRTSVHFRALHLHRYYAERFGYRRGMFPNAEFVSDRTLSLPLSAGTDEADVDRVITVLRELVADRDRRAGDLGVGRCASGALRTSVGRLPRRRQPAHRLRPPGARAPSRQRARRPAARVDAGHGGRGETARAARRDILPAHARAPCVPTPGRALLVIDDPSRRAARRGCARRGARASPVASIHDVGIAPLASDLAIDGSLGARRVDGLGRRRGACLLGPALRGARARSWPCAAPSRASGVAPTARWSALGGGRQAAAGAWASRDRCAPSADRRSQG